MFVLIGTPRAVCCAVEVERRWPALVHPAYEAFRVTWSDPGRFFFFRPASFDTRSGSTDRPDRFRNFCRDRCRDLTRRSLHS